MRYFLRLVCLLGCVIASTAGAATVITPTITTQPIPQTVTAGAKVFFTVTAVGTSLKYQWQSKINGNTTNISGATKSTYTITKVVPANAGAYQCVVSNTAGHVTSNSVMLTIKPNYAGKYNLAIVNYSGSDLITYYNTQAPGPSGDALYGTATVTGSSDPYAISISVKKYAGSNLGNISTYNGTVSNGVVTITGQSGSLNFIQANGAAIGLIGSANESGNFTFIVGLTASSSGTAPKSFSPANFTLVIIGYNATAVTKANPAKNDYAVEIGNETVDAHGNFKINAAEYATGGGDYLGNYTSMSGSVSTSGVVTIGGVRSAIVTKPVFINGQVVGFQGNFTIPDDGKPFSHILIGVSGLYAPP